jgi:hypothetical protein
MHILMAELRARAPTMRLASDQSPSTFSIVLRMC